MKTLTAHTEKLKNILDINKLPPPVPSDSDCEMMGIMCEYTTLQAATIRSSSMLESLVFIVLINLPALLRISRN